MGKEMCSLKAEIMQVGKAGRKETDRLMGDVSDRWDNAEEEEGAGARSTENRKE